jgi:predicted RNA binding protein YcfA (HicA-like mRNA interferase family)
MSARQLSCTVRIYGSPDLEYRLIRNWGTGMADPGGDRESVSGLARVVTARRLIGALHSDGFLLVRTRMVTTSFYWHSDGQRVVVACHRPNDTFRLAR